MTPDKYDIMVIGSGIGGLVTGSLLSQNYKVLVVEKNNFFGGYCSDFSRNGFRFEAALQAINGFYKDSPIFDILKKSDALKGLEMIKPAHLYRAVYPGHDINVPQSDPVAYKNILVSSFPKESDGIDRLLMVFKMIHKEMSSIYKGGSLKKCPYILQYYKRSLQYLLNEYIHDEKLKAIIAQYWMYRGLPPSKLSSITFAYIWYDYTVNGSYFLEEGSAAIIKNLVDSIRRNGGEVMGGKKVSELYICNDMVKEAVLSDGYRIRADTFISNIDVFKTFGMMANTDTKIVDPFLIKLKENTLSISAIKIYLGLDIDVKTLGILDYETFVSPSYDMESMYESSIENDPHKMPYTVTIYSNLSSKFCKPGHSVVSIGALSGYRFWEKLNRTEYLKKKEELADVILERYERIFPNLRKYIKTKIIGTPLTMERYTGNSEGAIYGWNKKNLSEEIRFIHPTTPLKNLFLSSHWTKMGGGVGGVLLSSDRVCKLLLDKVVA